MARDGFNKLFWGFLFILLSFRIQGFDILPDIVGYIFFAVGLSTLSVENDHFEKAKLYNIIMLIFSIFSIYQPQSNQAGIHLAGPALAGIFGTVLASIIGIAMMIAGFIFELLLVYNICMGAQEMAIDRGNSELSLEADKRWKQFVILQVLSMAAFILVFIPFINILYIIVIFVYGIAVAIFMMTFMRRCSEEFGDTLGM